MEYGKKLNLSTNKNTSTTILIPLKTGLVVHLIHGLIHHTFTACKTD